MERLDFVRQAILTLGDAQNEDLSAFIEKKYGVTIEPKYLPLYRATIRELSRNRQPTKSEQAPPNG